MISEEDPGNEVDPVSGGPTKCDFIDLRLVASSSRRLSGEAMVFCFLRDVSKRMCKRR